jgi:DNA uptake protein ComE-like DNA-binding protein
VGLKSWQVKNLLAYRRAGGHWKDVDDFKRLYGLSEEEYQRLRPYIQIPPPVKDVYFTEKDRARQDSLRQLRPEKFAELTVLDLNTVDTLTLRKIPGIGVGYSRSIVSYRQRLGGFVSVAQLKDIEGLPERIEEWFSVGENVEVRTISINKSDFKTLVRHPYLSYEQVKVITTHIRKYGQLRSWKDLQLYPEFTPQDFERLTPYFVFE